MLNSRSVKNKTHVIKDFAIENNIDILGITEMWLSKGSRDKAVIKDLIPTGYKLHHIPRSHGRGGGVGVLFKNTLDLKSQQISRYLSFEYTEVLLKANRRCVRTVLIHRPLPSAENKLYFSMFVREFTCLLELSITSGELLIFGDFNLHVENSSDSHACQFLDLLTSFLGCEINPNHVHGHVFDLVITRVTENIVSNVSVHGEVVSDHNSVIFNLAADKLSFLSKHVSYRKWKNVDIKDFTLDITQSALVTTLADNVSILVTQYN